MAEPWSDGDVQTASDLAGLPWGVMGYVNGSTSDQTGITTVADVTGLSVTFTAVSSRLYRTTLTVCVQQKTAGDTPNVYITDGSDTAKKAASATLDVDEISQALAIVLLETGLSGSVTRKGRAAVGSGSVTVVGTQDRYPTIIVEDMGAA